MSRMSLADLNQSLSSLRCIPELRPRMQSISAKCAAGSRDSLAQKIQESQHAVACHATENAENLHPLCLYVLSPALSLTATSISVLGTTHCSLLPLSGEKPSLRSGNPVENASAHIIEDLHPEKTKRCRRRKNPRNPPSPDRQSPLGSAITAPPSQ